MATQSTCQVGMLPVIDKTNDCIHLQINRDGISLYTQKQNIGRLSYQ